MTFMQQWLPCTVEVPPEELDLCPVCNGSGEGQHEGTRCSNCNGKGEV